MIQMTRVTTPLFIIISVSLFILSAIVSTAGNNLLVRLTKEAMPMFKKAVLCISETIWALGVNMVSGVILA